MIFALNKTKRPPESQFKATNVARFRDVIVMQKAAVAPPHWLECC